MNCVGGNTIWGHDQEICESFVHQNPCAYQFAIVFSLESFPLYGSSLITVKEDTLKRRVYSCYNQLCIVLNNAFECFFGCFC